MDICNVLFCFEESISIGTKGPFRGKKNNRLLMLRLVLPGPIQKTWVSLIGKFHIAKGCLDKKHLQMRLKGSR